MVRTTFLVTGALAVAALGFQMPSAYADHSWGNYHWSITGESNDPVELNLVLGDNLRDSWKPTDGSSPACETGNHDAGLYLKTACFDWSESVVLTTTIELGTTNSKNCKATDGRVEVCSERYGNNGWLGLAQIWISGGHITKAIAKLNDFYFDMDKYTVREWRFFVMCQEIGHTFGLGHSDEVFTNTNEGTCMDYTNDPAGTDPKYGPKSNEHPNDHDYYQLEKIYHKHPPQDESESADKPGNGKGGGNGKGSGAGKLVSVTGFEFAAYVRDDPNDWGTAVAFTSKGQPRLFVKDLGEGEKRITHVTWTEDARAGAHFPHQH